MKTPQAVGKLASLAQETRLSIFRLLVQAGARLYLNPQCITHIA